MEGSGAIQRGMERRTNRRMDRELELKLEAMGESGAFPRCFSWMREEDSAKKTKDVRCPR